jgi:hypothetical protein
MRKFLGVAAVALMSAGLALAGELDGLIGNTLVIKDAKGSVLAKTQFKQDGSYETTRGASTKVTGTWRVDGQSICTKEAGTEDEECVNLALNGKAKGQSWKVTGDGLNLSLSVE